MTEQYVERFVKDFERCKEDRWWESEMGDEAWWEATAEEGFGAPGAGGLSGVLREEEVTLREKNK